MTAMFNVSTPLPKRLRVLVPAVAAVRVPVGSAAVLPKPMVLIPAPMSMLPTIAPVFEMVSSPAPSVMLPVKAPALVTTVLPPAVMLPVIWPTSIPVKSLSRLRAPAELEAPLN